MSLTGDFAKLQTMIAAFEEAGASDFTGALGKNLAAETISLVQREFRSQSDPYGAAWAPLKARSGMILSDTGHLRGSVTVAGSSTEVRVVIGASYGAYHQRGTRRMPARPILPREGDIPSAWVSAYFDVTISLLDQVFAAAAQ